MGKKNQARKGRSGAPQGGGAVDSLSADLSDLFKTLPPIKRADLTKTVEKLFQVIRESKRLKQNVCDTKAQVSSNFSSEPLTPAKQWAEFQEIQTLVEKVSITGFSLA